MSYAVQAFPTWFDTLRTRDMRHVHDSQAWQQLVRSYAPALPNERWSSMTMRWMNEVDETLANAGSAIRVTDLFSSDPRLLPGFSFRPADDSSQIGHVLHADLAATLSGLDVPLQGPVAESVEELRSWLRHCVDRGADLITFYG